VDDQVKTAGGELLRQIERCQDALTDQQRVLLRTPDELSRATALRGAGALVQQLDDLKTTAEQLSRELQAQAGEQESLRGLQKVGAAINSSLNLDVVLQQVMDAIVRLTRAERAMLLLDNRGELEVKMARNISQETLDDDASLEISRSIARHVAETGEPIVTINAQEDERFSAQHSIVSYKLRSILCAPLKLKGQTIGVIYADNRIASGIFSDADRDLLAGFADQAAVAIDNARLFHEVAGMKQLMDNVFASIASGVVTIDADDRIALYTRAAESILGVPAEAVLSHPYMAALDALGLPIAGLIDQVKRDGSTRSTELDLSAARRTVSPTTVNLTISPLHTVDDERLGGVALVLDDVSEKKRVESLRRYLPPELVDQVRDLDGAQRPQRRTITVLFADIRDFSRFGEHADPEELIDLANGFFSVAVAAINDHHGLIDKFMGDAVMALFNTPLNPQADHVDRAVRAAWDIQTRLAAHRRSLPPEKVLHFGIGLHTGETVVGNVGSAKRKDYSAVGDVVNLCKRLQELADSDQILLSREVHERVRDRVTVETLPPVQVKGRQTMEEVFRLLGLSETHQSTTIRA
jgi:class 3 adenylate cyclase/GAF domain-containing protein